MTRQALPPGHPSFDRFTALRYSVFRLETLQVYGGSGEDPALTAFHRGDPAPPDSDDARWWANMLRANRDAGRAQQRVHVVHEPVTPYMAFELTWQYGPHTAAGEDIRIISVTGEQWPPDVPRCDFWLFDSREVYWMRYDDGTWLGADHTTEPADVAEACAARDAALAQARPWSEFIAERPELSARLSMTASRAR